MAENKDIPQFVACGLEMGNCGYQIPYDMAEHERIIRADAIDECKKIVMAECTTTCEYPFSPNCVECISNKMEKLKEQSNE